MTMTLAASDARGGRGFSNSRILSQRFHAGLQCVVPTGLWISTHRNWWRLFRGRGMRIVRIGWFCLARQPGRVIFLFAAASKRVLASRAIHLFYRVGQLLVRSDA